MAKKDNTGTFLGIGAGLLLLWAFSNKSDAANTTTNNNTTNLPPAPPGGTKLTPTQFVQAYWASAQKSETDTGVPALVTISQAAIETGWGVHAPGNNFFGMQAGSSWTGDTQQLQEWQCGTTGDPAQDGITSQVITTYPPGDSNGFASCSQNGKYSYRVLETFRKYATPADSFTDHGYFLKNNPRYAALFQTTTPEDFAKAFQGTGYSSAPNYVSVLLQVMALIQKVLSAM